MVWVTSLINEHTLLDISITDAHQLFTRYKTSYICTQPTRKQHLDDQLFLHFTAAGQARQPQTNNMLLT